MEQVIHSCISSSRYKRRCWSTNAGNRAGGGGGGGPQLAAQDCNGNGGIGSFVSPSFGAVLEPTSGCYGEPGPSTRYFGGGGGVKDKIIQRSVGSTQSGGGGDGGNVGVAGTANTGSGGGAGFHNCGIQTGTGGEKVL